MGKQNVVYLYNGVLFIQPPAIMWINFENIMLSEKSQTQKDKYCSIPLFGDT